MKILVIMLQLIMCLFDRKVSELQKNMYSIIKIQLYWWDISGRVERIGLWGGECNIVAKSLLRLKLNVSSATSVKLQVLNRSDFVQVVLSTSSYVFVHIFMCINIYVCEVVVSPQGHRPTPLMKYQKYCQVSNTTWICNYVH